MMLPKALAVALLCAACSANAATPAIGSGGGMSPDRVKTFRIPDFVCRPSNTPTNNGTNVCGSMVVVPLRDRGNCTFDDAVADWRGSSSSNYYKGAAALQIVAWSISDSQGYREWYVYWVNVMNQPIYGYGNYVYADVYCHKPEQHFTIKTQAVKQ